jgi:predicted nucleic acid-binding protein
VSLVIDASVAAKWVLPEADSANAVGLRGTDVDLLAPSLVAIELGNTIWKSVSRGDAAQSEAAHILRIAIAHYSRIVPTEELLDDALSLAIELDHPIYDCFYLALAERERAPLVTADKRLLGLRRKVKGVEIMAL